MPRLLKKSSAISLQSKYKDKLDSAKAAIQMWKILQLLQMLLLRISGFLSHLQRLGISPAIIASGEEGYLKANLAADKRQQCHKVILCQACHQNFKLRGRDEARPYNIV